MLLLEGRNLMGSDLNMQAGSMDDTSDCDEMDRSSRMMEHGQNVAFRRS